MTSKHYHHGDLKQAVLAAATDMIREQGVHGFSMRQLAQKLGVSRTAAYHHFKDRQQILEALALAGFNEHKAWLDELSAQTESDQTRLAFEASYREYIRRYIDFADKNPEIYELMFGADIWRRQKPSSELEDFAKQVFIDFIAWIKQAQDQRQIGDKYSSRMSGQLAWATIHGICRLIIDGVYTDARSLQQVVEMAMDEILNGVFAAPKN